MLRQLGCGVLLAGLGAGFLYAAPQAADDKGSATQTITGCLEKGVETDGYYLISNGKKHWELYPETGMSLSEHVGHTIAVTGTVAHRSAEQEQVSQPNERKEIGNLQHADLNVTSVKHVSGTCKK